jgi:hypothetical protein
MTEFYKILIKKNLTLNDFRTYEKQMPEMRKRLHTVIKSLIDEKGITFMALSKELVCDRGKVYRMYYGWDSEDLPQRWAKEEDDIIRENYQKKTCQQIAEILNRTKGGVSYRMKLFGLRKKKVLKNVTPNLGQYSQ